MALKLHFMLSLNILHQQQYSKKELLLRSFFGWLYIAIPHFFMLYFIVIAHLFVAIYAFFSVLFTGKTPEIYYSLSMQMNRWILRVTARLLNLSDGNVQFGLQANDDKTQFELPFYQINRGELLLRIFLGWLYVGIPHGFILYFRYIGSFFLIIFAWWVVLFTGKYPENWHKFVVGTLRWSTRVSLFFGFLYPTYPPFHGRQDQALDGEKLIDQL